MKLVVEICIEADEDAKEDLENNMPNEPDVLDFLMQNMSKIEWINLSTDA